MSIKVKGLLKGLRFISQIFDEEKEPEIEIGNPTDVKHVAHIGWDGPSPDSANWIEEFKSPTGLQPSPLSSPSKPKGKSESKRTSEDSRRSNKPPSSLDNDHPEVLKSPRKKDSTTKSRQSRRQHNRLQESNQATNAPEPDGSKKTRRKKSKESTSGSGSSKSRSKAATSNGPPTSPKADPGLGTGSIIDAEERNIV